MVRKELMPSHEFVLKEATRLSTKWQGIICCYSAGLGLGHVYLVIQDYGFIYYLI